MPSKNKKQGRLMAGIAHGTIPAGKGKPSKEVAQEFNQADKGTGILKGKKKKKK
jgi:hypothetical protein